MRTLTIAPLSIGLVPRTEQSASPARAGPRMLLDTSGSTSERRTRPTLRQVPALPSVDAVGGVDPALLKLQDLFFASCIDYPSDEQLQQRVRMHCSRIEANLLPGELRAWRSGRDCVLARLGFHLLLD